LTSKPSVEENWYREMKRLGVGYQVDLCPESGNCRVNVTKLSELQRMVLSGHVGYAILAR